MSASNARLIEKDIMASIGPDDHGDSDIIDLTGASKFSCQAVYDVQAPSAKTFASPAFARLVNQGITFTANTIGAGGNAITINMTGTQDPPSVSVIGTAIQINLAQNGGGDNISTAADVIAAVNGSVPVHALITATGAGAVPLVNLATTHLASGADGVISVAASTIALDASAMGNGLKVRLTTTGTLPAPFLTGTDYFVIKLSDSLVQLAETLDDADDGTFIVIEDTGSNNAVGTMTAQALSGASVTFQKSNSADGPWINIQSATSITVDGSVIVADSAVCYRYFKAVKALTAGQVDLACNILVIGPAV